LFRFQTMRDFEGQCQGLDEIGREAGKGMGVSLVGLGSTNQRRLPTVLVSREKGWGMISVDPPSSGSQTLSPLIANYQREGDDK